VATVPSSVRTSTRGEQTWQENATRILYVDLCPKLSMSEDVIKQAVRRMKLRCREIMRSKIASTVDSVNEVDDQLRQLMRIL
jgi:hypothetical protein